MDRVKSLTQRFELKTEIELTNMKQNETDDHAGSGRCSWFKAMRHEDGFELIKKNKNAFLIAYLIASRSRYSERFNADELTLGEAMIGDSETLRMTRQEHRTALKHLVDGRFITIRTTNKGTIAKLTDTRLFSVLNMAGNHQNNLSATSNQPTSTNQQPLTRRK